MPLIIETVKKDLKNDHLKKDFTFIKKFLASKNVQKVSVEELVDAYSRAIAEEENGESLAEFITTRWMLKHTEIYDFFENYLNSITTDFTALDELSEDHSNKLIEASIAQFGAPKVYIFSILNSVVFPSKAYQNLKSKAQTEKEHKQIEEQQLNEKLSVEKMQRSFEQEIARLTDKYEKKLAGLQKKYTTDVEGLKKQISQLQRKLHEKGA